MIMRCYYKDSFTKVWYTHCIHHTGYDRTEMNIHVITHLIKKINECIDIMIRICKRHNIVV